MTLFEIKTKLASPEFQIPISRERYMDLFKFQAELCDMLNAKPRPAEKYENMIWKLLGKIKWRIRFNFPEKKYKQRTL